MLKSEPGNRKSRFVKMEAAIISDESSDVDIKTMKDQLIEFGLDEENLSKEEMADLLKALNNSKSTAKEDDLLRHKPAEPATNSPEKSLKRRYLNVRDRRMPWSVLPSDLTNAEKARALAVYIKLMSINRYRQARLSATFMSWPTPLQIIEETNSRVHSMRSTRSGRNVPLYCGDIDDDDSDIDFVVTKPKKRKISGSDNAEGLYSNKVVSLKRKNLKEEQHRPMKELKINNDDNKIEASTSSGITKPKRAFFSLIED